MSQNFLSKIKRKKADKPLAKRDWRAIVLFPLWVLVAFFAAQAIVAGGVWVAREAGVDFATIGSTAVIQAALSATVYVVAFILTFGVPYIAMKRRVTLETLGLTRLMSWTDIGLAPLAYVAYVIVLLTVLAVVTRLFPGFEGDQVQDVGFKALTNQTGYIVAFATLVVLAPIAEEVLFRGYLYGKMRRHIPLWATALATSILFAAIHGQWNVAVDTFVLSLALCGLRELTGSIWAGILVHMIKNGIAFYILFISPLVAPTVGG